MIEGQPRSFSDCWKDTYTGLYESSRPEPERSQLLSASKMLMHRLSRKPNVQKSFNDELQEVLKSHEGEQKGETTELSSTGSRVERAAANRERRWWDLTTQVYKGELSPKSCQRQLRNKYGMQAQLKHINEAVSRLKRHDEPMRWEDCAETRGRATLLTDEQELSLIEDVKCMLSFDCWFHWSLICQWARDMYVADNPNEEPSASNRFGYHWYTCFLKRHGMRVTKLAVRDNKRSNSATPSSIAHYYSELHEFLLKLRFAEKNEEHDPEKPYSPCLKWLPGMTRRVVLGDETSVHMKLDGTRRFTYVSRLHEPPSRIDVPMPQFRCSVLGARNAEGDCFAPMFVTQRDFKWKDECTARGTVLVNGAPQTPQWAHNEKGSFNESNFIHYLKNILAPAYPDLSPDNPIVLIVDGVKTHATPEVVKTAHELGIRIFLLPPNCTHLLQGEDLVNFPIFKNEFNAAKLDHLTKVTYSAFILNAMQSRCPHVHAHQRTKVFANVDSIMSYFAQTFSPAWTKAFSRENNLKGLEIQGLLNLDRHALWRNFPDWRGQLATTSASSSQSADSTNTPMSTSTNNSNVTSRVRHGAHIFDDSVDAKPIDGSKDEVGRLVPFLEKLEQVQQFCYGNNDIMPEQEFKALIECAKNSMRRIVLKDYQVRKRGRAPRGELTLDDALERANKQRKVQPDPARVRQKEVHQQRRAELYATLQKRMETQDWFEKTLTLSEMVDVLHHLKHAKLFDGSVPQAPKRPQLERLLQRSWPALIAFNEESMLQGHARAERGRQTTGRVARKSKATAPREREPAPLGCASCRGRAEGCRRCIKWRDDGRIPTSMSKSGFPLWTVPDRA